MRKIFSFLLVLLMAVMSIGSAQAASVVAEGDGWKLYSNGNMMVHSVSLLEYNDWKSSNETPWASYRNQITEVHFYSPDEGTVESLVYISPYMFADMNSLREVNFHIEAVKKIMICSHAFENSSIKVIGRYYWAEIASISDYAFKNCKSLSSISVGYGCYASEHSFEGCTALKEVIGKITRVYNYAFKGCTALSDISLAYVASIGDYAFDGCTSLKGIEASQCMTIGKYAFRDCSLTSIVMKDIQSIGDYAFSGAIPGGHFYLDRTYPPTLGTNVFYGIDLYSITLHTPSGSTGYNVAPWNQFRSETEEPIVYGALSGTTLTLYYDDQRSARVGTSWDVSTYYKLDLMNTATKIVIDPSMLAVSPAAMGMWFYGFEKVTTIEGLQYLNTSATTDMYMMFNSCKALKSIDLSNLNTANVEDMHNMFDNCTSLRTVNLNSLDMSSVTRVDGMFSGCTALEKIECDADWTQLNKIVNADRLFHNCTSLKGGKGTVYDANYKNLDYARPDGGPDAPGYFWTATDDGINHQGIDNVQSDKVQGTKVIRDGMLLIERNGKTFNAQGVEVR